MLCTSLRTASGAPKFVLTAYPSGPLNLTISEDFIPLLCDKGPTLSEQQDWIPDCRPDATITIPRGNYNCRWSGEDSAVVYGVCQDCNRSLDESLERIVANLTSHYRGIYYSIVYGDLDSTDGWGPVSVH